MTMTNKNIICSNFQLQDALQMTAASTSSKLLIVLQWEFF